LRIAVAEAILDVAIDQAQPSTWVADSDSLNTGMGLGSMAEERNCTGEGLSTQGRRKSEKRSAEDDDIDRNATRLAKRSLTQTSNHLAKQPDKDIDPPPAVRYNVPHFSGGAYYSRGMSSASSIMRHPIVHAEKY
jgi:hypothetical protein